jgi:F-type H+-transporting ATPase subunit a
VKPKVLLAAIIVLAMVAVGFIVAKGPQPEISVPAEEIFSIAGIHITNAVITAYTVTALLVIVTYFATRKASIIPSGFYNFVEAIVEWLLSVVEEIAGARNARKFFPVVATIFLFVISCNYFGLLPIVNSIGVAHRSPNQTTGVVMQQSGGVYLIGSNATQVKEGDKELTNEDQVSRLGNIKPFFRSVNSDVNSPMAIAFWSFFFVELWGIGALGIHYFGKFLAFPPFAKSFSPINVFVGFLELISEFIRIVSFTFRLFGNIFAGDVLILFISFLAPFIVPVVFYGLETFVGFIQAAVFALLTLVFAVMAVESHDEGEHEAHGAHGEHAEAAAH